MCATGCTHTPCRTEGCDARRSRKARKNLGTTQKKIEEAAHSTENDRDKTMEQTPENMRVRVREEAAAKCTRVIERRVLQKKARKARADHPVKCSLMPRNTKIKKAVGGVVFQRVFHGRQRRMAKALRRDLHCVHSLRVAHAFSLHIFLAWRTYIAYTHGSRCLQCACHISPSHLFHSHVSSAIFAVPARSLRHHVPVRTVLEKN